MRIYRDALLSIAVLTLILSGSIAALASEFRLLEAQGTVQVKPEGQSRYRRVREGRQLRLGDRLRTTHNAQARILCDDLTSTWTMYSNQESGVAEGCPSSPFSTRLRIGNQDDNTPGGSDRSIPYVITPRRTAVLGTEPIALRWNPVLEAERYVVQVVGPEVTWETQVEGTQVLFDEVDALVPGAEYQVIVEANNGLSSQLDEGAETATFERLYVEDIEIIQAGIAALPEQDLSEETQLLVAADLYIREDLLADAVNLLESLTASGTQSLEAYQDLGDIYRYIGLNLLAQARYEQAIEIALASQDIGGLADAQAGLAEVEVMLDQHCTAVDLLAQARDNYTAIEDVERVNELEERLGELNASSVATCS